MPLSLPSELKRITPFIRRAEELDRDKSNAESRLVAYYCRQYAVHTGINLAQSPAGKTALGDILNELEKEKEAMSAFTREESKFLCLQFAEKIFNKADEEDRAGQATKNTAKTFYAAASFLEILQQFYNQGEEGMEEERDEISKKTKYAKWKATDILKAFKEGRTPAPGGYGEDASADTEEEKEEENEELPSAPANTDISPPPVPTAPPAAPTAPPQPLLPTLPQPPSSPPMNPTVETVEREEAEQGTEVELGPPPAYPVQGKPDGPKEDSTEVFLPPPPNEPIKKAKSPAKIFGFRSNKNSKKASKESLADATELTKFALAALESKDAQLASTRLTQALEALSR